MVQSIKRAHENLRPMRMHVNSGELLDANINRSPSAYLANPEGERKRYKHDTDKEMTLLSMHCDASGRCAGCWRQKAASQQEWASEAVRCMAAGSTGLLKLRWLPWWNVAGA